MITIIMSVLAYLLASISSAILICQMLNLPDPRTTGSENPGATNVLRISNKPTAAMVLLFDVLKGTIPVWSGYFIGLEPVYLGVIAVAACLGHMYPIFFDFKGGKAVATAFGVLLPIGYDLAGLLILTWFFVVKQTRYSSLAAIVTVTLAPIYTYLLKPIYVYPVLMISGLIIFRHKSNIIRLIKGTEPKVDKSPKDDDLGAG
ncbi:glycerol-3-phosphate 1-O-acyltransferase PlsY [Thalassotalea sp. LPB0316]|uniref:glycerol-3-phosphate 1-O-acyltransferase PlsY n=1 Tax=Thalassotalea sp. LPB0316 TaxID=2769490 RepID=UPI00186664E0|nr:glycerol-3-phosphate 1-O-acyltransferase PlsY [Thalassotalea sp. LPB0316]QOL27188.1 glycerol-3-phosphate 1-O-acyltransferase PlsY [Thalassotalea sp. LPB0316]